MGIFRKRHKRDGPADPGLYPGVVTFTLTKGKHHITQVMFTTAGVENKYILMGYAMEALVETNSLEEGWKITHCQLHIFDGKEVDENEEDCTGAEGDPAGEAGQEGR